MSNFFHRLFNPHCPHCIEEAERNKKCDTCDVLRVQLELANVQNQQLLDRLTAKPEQVVSGPPAPISRPMHVPWSVRRQMLEQADKEKARAMTQAAKPDTESETVTIQPKNLEELEKELGVVDGEVKENV
jgi:hypothetical protein